jgi:phosphatidylserine decarboxylase
MKINLKDKLYTTFFGKLALETIVKHKPLNMLAGSFADSSLSRYLIPWFTRTYDIDTSKFVVPEKGFRTLNEFFTRDYKQKIFNFPEENLSLGSPAEGWLSVQENLEYRNIIQVKGSYYPLSDFLKSEMDRSLIGGTMIKIRLTPKEYHHFHHVDSGRFESFTNIPGKYYSTDFSGIKNIPELYCKNHRNITRVESSNFGKITYVEVGATFVGTMQQNFNPEYRQYFERGNKKGCFKFGGSTIILFFEKDKIKIKEDIASMTMGARECYVNLGQIIAEAR